MTNRLRRAVVATAAGLLVLAGSAPADADPVPAARTFFLTLDAVPYTAVAALYAGGSAPELFGELGAPVPLISTFPSTTTVALTAALAPLGLDISPGYEARFFDWREDRVRGGGAISYFRIVFPWRDFFQWSRKGVARSALASLRPVAASENRAISAFEAFLAADQRNFFAYVETTDTAGHLKGPASLDGMFRELGRAIRAAREAGEEFHVVLFSDHGIDGGEPLVNVLPGIHARLRQLGLREVRRLRQPNDVALTPYGLVSSFEFYAREEMAPRLAETLVSVEGVALCAYRSDGELLVASDDGLATIARRGAGRGQEWAYRTVAGDPLRYRDVVSRTRASQAAAPAGDWYSDGDWFEATKREFYPDALHRIAGAFELIDNPATVICSTEPGYMYGPKRTERAARMTGGRLRWTHGALFWNASAGFLLTDLAGPATSPGIRLSEALLPLVSAERARSARVVRQEPESPSGHRR